MKRNNLIVGLLLIVVMLILVLYHTNTTHHASHNTQHTGHKMHHQDHKAHQTSNDAKNICTGYLTDKEYLEHMIPHHQVAVDISYMLQKKTRNPLMQKILRELIWMQEYEIKLMNIAKEKLPEGDMSSLDDMSRLYIPTLSDYTEPNTLDLTDTYCDPHFFDPEAHMKHMHHMELTDEMYIKHMIPHHQVAVDMSKVLLKNTKNDFMIYLAYRIIRSQQAEIVMLDVSLCHKIGGRRRRRNMCYYKEEFQLLLIVRFDVSAVAI